MSLARFSVVSILLGLSIYLANLAVPLVYFAANLAPSFSSPLTELNYHPVNNVARMALLTLLPAFVWWMISRPFPTFQFEGLYQPSCHGNFIFAVVLSFMIVLAVNIARQALLPPAYQPLDLYHDGIFLSGVVEWMNGNPFFSNSFLHYGPIYEQILPLMFARLSGNADLAVIRVLFHLLQFSIWVSVGIFILNTSLVIRKIAGGLSASVLVVLLMAVHLFRWRAAQYSDPREAINALAMAYLIWIVLKPNRIHFYVLGGLIWPMALFSVDRGIIFAALTLIPLLVSKSKGDKDSKTVLSNKSCYALGLGTVGVILANVLGLNVLYRLIRNAIDMNRWYDWMMSSPFPVLGKDNVEHSLLIASVVICLIGFWHLKKGVLKDDKLTQVALVFTLTALLHLRSVIAIPDRHHVIYSSTYAQLGVAFYAWWYLQRFHWRVNAAVLSLLVMLMNPVSEAIQLVKERHTFAGSMRTLLASAREEDGHFMDQDTRSAVGELRELFKDEKCLTVFPNTPALYYLLNKPGCGRFHVTVFASPPDFQTEWISNLSKLKPQRIVYASPFAEYNSFDGVTMEKRLPVVKEYLAQHYEFEKNVHGWLVYRRRS